MPVGESILGALVAAVLVCTSHAASADGGASAGDVVRTTRGADVYSAPQKSSRHARGLVMRGARFRVLERSRGKGCNADWLRIEDGAWICAKHTRATDEAPGGARLPALKPGKALPFTYVVTRNAPVYKSIADIKAGAKPGTLPGTGGFKYRGSRRIGGAKYVRTDRGWIPADRARVVTQTEFRGVPLTAADRTKRQGFVSKARARIYDADGERVTGLTAPKRHQFLADIGAPVTRGNKTLYPIGEGRYMLGADLGILDFPAPASVEKDEHWVDVNMAEQTLIAYAGTTPVFATLVSTAHTKTPIGEFRIEKKRPFSRMRSKPYYRTKWDTYAPWVISIKGRIAMHAVYWHEDFGTARSMGCVNLSPRDAKWIWDFTYPILPAGWLRIETNDGSKATLVRIRRTRLD